MNKYEKALQYAKQTMNIQFIMEGTILEVLQELAPRATPKKTIPTHPVVWKECPSCHNGVYPRSKFCMSCGQALDWSE